MRGDLKEVRELATWVLGEELTGDIYTKGQGSISGVRACLACAGYCKEAGRFRAEMRREREKEMMSEMHGDLFTWGQG